MIKDVMVRLDGSAADEVRLAAVNEIAELFHSQVIGLFLNVLPLVIAAEDGVSAIGAAELLRAAREAGDKVEARLLQRLNRLQKPVELRRFDILSEDTANVVAREARAADTFVALRPNGAPHEPEHLVEGVLFGSGRHLFLVPNRKPAKAPLEHVVVAWNGSRESARALADALPYLHKANQVTVVVVDEEPPMELQAVLGTDAVNHLKHHGNQCHPASRQNARQRCRGDADRGGSTAQGGPHRNGSLWPLPGARVAPGRRDLRPLALGADPAPGRSLAVSLEGRPTGPGPKLGGIVEVNLDSLGRPAIQKVPRRTAQMKISAQHK
jgi:hypothetical protein